MASIYVYSPSGAVRNRAAFRRGMRYLQGRGHTLAIDPGALARWQRFAGDDSARLAAIERAAASGADIALITRGGYGLTRLLPQMPWRKLARAADSGTRFVGFSDFTVLQLGLLAHCGSITWSGPTLCEGFGGADGVSSGVGKPACDKPDDITAACFEDMANADGEGTGWRLPVADMAHLEGRSGLLARNACLWGGNLTMVLSLLGTPWWPAIRGGVLFLEEVGEHPYRIERMLDQLLHAGVLQQQKAIVLGRFTDFKLSPHDRGFNLARVIERLRLHLKIPVLTGLPFGHVPTKVLLPVGAKVDLLIERGEALLLWGHLH